MPAAASCAATLPRLRFLSSGSACAQRDPAEARLKLSHTSADRLRWGDGPSVNEASILWNTEGALCERVC